MKSVIRASDAPAERLPSTPRPVGSARKVHSIRFVVQGAFDVSKLTVQKNPWSFQVTGFLSAILSYEKELAARAMTHLPNAVARSAKAPIARDAAKCP